MSQATPCCAARGLHLLWRLMHAAKGVVQAAFAGLTPETLDLLTWRRDDLGAAPGTGGDCGAVAAGKAHRHAEAWPGLAWPLHPAGCVAQLRFPESHSGPPSTPGFFQAFYDEVDADAKMAAVRGRLHVSHQPLVKACVGLRVGIC
jgi:hypothetical protein